MNEYEMMIRARKQGINTLRSYGKDWEHAAKRIEIPGYVGQPLIVCLTWDNQVVWGKKGNANGLKRKQFLSYEEADYFYTLKCESALSLFSSLGV